MQKCQFWKKSWCYLASKFLTLYKAGCGSAKELKLRFIHFALDFHYLCFRHCFAVYSLSFFRRVSGGDESVLRR